MSSQNAPQPPAPATDAPATPPVAAAPRSARTSAAKPERTRMFAYGAGPAADPAGSHFERRIRSFQPRRSRVTTGQGEALRRLWPVWGIDVDGQRVLDLDEMFGGRPVVLEIGFGMGEATARMAADDPDTGILAVDVHTPGQGNLLNLADQLGLDNVRVANGDAVILLREMLAREALAGLRVYFPDPWPKTRHHKRRLVQPEFLSLAAPRLAPGALLHCATDWEPYAEQMHDVLSAHPAYENTVTLPGPAVEGTDGVVRHGYAPRPAFRPRTRFEGQGLDKGHVVHDLLFRRAAPAAG
ncbi:MULTISPECIES: tRNA (guanosine(46)-N7)-methyltransferase TrmB [Streptomyces]|uniref:tRNA (guanosine(46)-N7)-methyltransferase TrmB n=1 Tax=Streptomyces TaxID=1883 RepID=UPI000C2562E3|nr:MULTISPECIES: tRNA (guanosine(46)-N7)-methyltransferase TrmB [Streptomyces]PJM81229.1 tRNA (guanosine(46)-N7)-methyltransferase TrmB [Streptomyces sp. TSRI0384-2]RPK89754.1 tRNA (guanine-N(7)-)-methyltransferase [Streptomyces sp. ADI98-12]GFH64472.1 tRNA (guanine-N(7)-)-methyltransferase [Streptomyces rutgersensis]